MISGIPPIPLATPVAVPSLQANDSQSSGFQNILQAAVNQVEGSGATADAAVQNFISGDGGELHSMILATQQADLQFEMFMQVRNKVVSAYEEIMKMQV